MPTDLAVDSVLDDSVIGDRDEPGVVLRSKTVARGWPLLSTRPPLPDMLTKI